MRPTLNTFQENAKKGVDSFIAISSEALGFAVASLAMRTFIPPLSAPFGGIALSLLCTKLAIKILTPYNLKPLPELSYQACMLRETYPKLQAISFLFALSISFLSRTLGFATGIIIGVYGGIIMEVENYKRKQKVSRQATLEKDYNKCLY